MSDTKLNSTEIAYFSGQMGMMISSGISVVESLKLLENETDSKTGKELLLAVSGSLESGTHLYDAMKSTGAFPDYVLNMVNIGEQTGNLDAVFESLSEYYEKNDDIYESIRSAVTYPFIMIMMMFIVIAVLLIKVMPIFEQVFRQLGASMTGFSAGILNFGKVLGRYSIVLVAIMAVLIFLYFFLTKSYSGREKARKFAAGFRPTRELFDYIAASRFAGGMALALSSGYNTMDGIAMVSEVVENSLYKKKIDKCREYISGGDAFADAIVKSELFSGPYGRMASIGFKSGRLEEVMRRIADRYDELVDRRITHFVSILEPTLVAVLSIIVGMILLSVMLPLVGIMSSIG